jgi:hypothetical protein
MNNIRAEIASVIITIATFCGIGLLILHIIQII